MRLPKVVADLALAESFQRLLDAGEVQSRADLARRFRLTRARVTQLMKLLALHPVIVAYVKSLPPGTPTRLVTERRMRGLVQLPHKRQFIMARSLLPGFLGFSLRMSERVA